MRRHVVLVLLLFVVMGCARTAGSPTPGSTAPPATASVASVTPASSQPSSAPGSTGQVTETCLGGLAQATCDEAARVARAAVAPSGWTPTWVWIDSGQLCPTQDCLFDPSQNYPYPEPPSGGKWVANAEVAFAGTGQHAGLNIATVGGTITPVLIGYRVPLLAWCSGGCPSSLSTEGVYKLELVLPHLSWKVGEPISGTAILSVTNSLPTKVAGAAELIAFAFDEVGGTRHVAPAWDQSCVQYPLDPATPRTVALGKSGVIEGTEPDVDFLRSFFADPQIHLPAGTWDVTAIASFSEGGCGAPTHTIEATVRIHVTD